LGSFVDDAESSASLQSFLGSTTVYVPMAPVQEQPHTRLQSGVLKPKNSRMV
jgi:hypothetical protein